MPTFVDGMGNKDRGYPKLNLDHVVKLKPIRRVGDHPEKHWDCLDAEGNTIGSITECDLPDPRAIVPNTTATMLVTFYEGDEYQQFFILPWLVDGTSVEPVIAGDLESDSVWCYEQRLGDNTLWIFPFAANFPIFADALAYARKQLDQRTERQEKARLAAVAARSRLRVDGEKAGA